MLKRSLFFIALTLCSALVYGQRDTIHLEGVVVTGTRAQVNRNHVPMTLSVISRQEINDSHESAVLSVLSGRVPGLFITERGITGFGVSTGGTGGISIRGIGGSPTTQVLVLIDGHPQYMGVMGHHLPDAYVTSDVERVEVIRGPASILYGSNAMGGVVNIITRRQEKSGVTASFRVMGGSHGTGKYMGTVGLQKGKYDGFISVNHDQTDGHRPNSGFRMTSGYARSGYNLSEHLRLWGDVSVASYRAQNPGTVTDTMVDNIAKITRGVASLTLENQHEKTGGSVKLFYNFGNHNINDGYGSGPNTSQKTPRDFRFRSKDFHFGMTLFQYMTPFEGSRITFGIDFKRFGGHAWDKMVDASTPNREWVDTSLHEIAGYILVQQRLFDQLTLSGGIRLEDNKAFGSEWVPQVGLTYTPSRHTVIKASIAKGFRSPTLRELYYRAGWAAANPDLKPERLTNYELSFSQAFLKGRLAAELTGYIADGTNIIQQEGTPPNAKNVNTGAFKNKGVELALRSHPVKGLTLRGQYAYLDLSVPMMNAPRQQASLSVSYEKRLWSVGADYQYTNDLYLTRGNNPVKESYGLLNARLQYLCVFVKGENLTNRDYQTLRGYPMPGITLFAGVAYSLNFLKAKNER